MRLRNRRLSIPNNTAVCELLGWRHSCSEGFNNHHLINKSRLKGNPKAKRYAEKVHPDVFIVRVCGFSNRSRLVDGREGRAKLIMRQMDRLEDLSLRVDRSVDWMSGEEYVRRAWDGFIRLFKGTHDLHIDSLL